MNRFLNSTWRWVLPAALLCFHSLYLPTVVLYDVKIGLHWLCYGVLFCYLFYLGQVQSVFKKLWDGLSALSFVGKTFLALILALIGAMAIILPFSTQTSPMYPLWQPLPGMWLIPWALAYIVLQPLVDNILYHKWLLGNCNTPTTRIAVFLVILLRTYVETGMLIYSKDSSLPERGTLSLAFFAVSAVFAFSYLYTKNEAVPFCAEVLYRLALVIAVFIGMFQLLPFLT